MPRNRAGAQLAINIPPDLLERLRAAALAQRRTVTAVVVEAIEAALPGGPAAALPAAADPSAPALLERLERLEVALAQLQQTPPAAAERVEPLRVPLGRGQLEIIGAAHLQAPAPAALELSPFPERRLTPDEAAGLLTGAEVARALGLAEGASTMRDWIAREARRRGGSAIGGIYRGFRLRGKGLLPEAQQTAWLWERVAPEA
jgi:predicted transcriptional regulator